MPLRTFLLRFLVLLLVATPARAEATHPLDALDSDEIAKAVALLRAAGHADDETLFASLSLKEPPKAEVLAWTPGDAIQRSAEAILRRGGTTYEAILDLTGGAVGLFRELPGAKPSIAPQEFLRASAAATADPRMRKGLEKRGLSKPSDVFCAPLTVGNFGAEEEQSRRLVKAICFDIRGTATGSLATPVEGLFASVDLDTGEVLAVTDLGVIPFPPGDPDFDAESVGRQRETRPVVQSTPQGSNIRVRGSQVAWQKWSFHVRLDPRDGVVLSLVAFDEGDGPRSVLYQGAMSEIFVPYQDPTEGWYFRSFMDQGEFGLAVSASILVPGADCPAGATYLSPTLANPTGGADELPNRICIFERALGEPLWRHYDLVTGALESRPALELVVRYIATVGNYDYVFDWQLDQQGNLTFRGGASGIDGIKGVRARTLAGDTAAEDTAWGPLIAPGRVGTNHDHFFSIRLDVDVDGVENTFVRDALVVEPQPEGSKRRSLWRVRPETAETDADAFYRLNFERPALWRVQSSKRTNAIGYPTSYALKPKGNALPLVDERDPPLARSFFATQHLWVTPYDPEERHAAGRFPNQAPGGGGLPQWTSRGRNVKDTDIVLWYTLGFHHVPSAEDWPVYNLGWHSVTLAPYNFFDRNPALDVPPVAGPADATD